MKRYIQVTVRIEDVKHLEDVVKEVEKVSKNHPYVSINIEVGKN